MDISNNEMPEKKFEITAADMGKLIAAAEDWVIMRYDPEEGIHLHAKETHSIGMIAILLAHNPPLWDVVKQSVHDIKKNVINKHGNGKSKVRKINS